MVSLFCKEVYEVSYKPETRFGARLPMHKLFLYCLEQRAVELLLGATFEDQIPTKLHLRPNAPDLKNRPRIHLLI
jgi:hypothetical protein